MRKQEELPHKQGLTDLDAPHIARRPGQGFTSKSHPLSSRDGHEIEPQASSKPPNSLQSMMLGTHGKAQDGQVTCSSLPSASLIMPPFAAGKACVFPTVPFLCL